MNAPGTERHAPSLRAAIAQRFNLLDDKADDADIDRSIRAGVDLRGATPWILMLAIVIAASISLLTSTLYFMATPLAEAQSELLARTTPTLWDVLIALAGGLAGVAIATALMPPLCTAGYGLANGNWAVFGGAFYLFSINCVFIAFAAVVVIEFLRLPHRKFIDRSKERRVKRTLVAVCR